MLVKLSKGVTIARMHHSQPKENVVMWSLKAVAKVEMQAGVALMKCCLGKYGTE